MNTDFLEVLPNWPKPYIFGTDLRTILTKSDASRQSIIKRTVQKGYLIPIRRDLYLVKNAKSGLIDSFKIVPILYGPSYVSFESALSRHGLIPEAVRTVTCASFKRSKEFFTGVRQHPGSGASPFIASPFKAIADMIYTRKRTRQSIDELSEDLRIEIDHFQSSDREVLVELTQIHPSPRVRKGLKILLNGLRK